MIAKLNRRIQAQQIHKSIAIPGIRHLPRLSGNPTISTCRQAAERSEEDNRFAGLTRFSSTAVYTVYFKHAGALLLPPRARLVAPSTEFINSIKATTLPATRVANRACVYVINGKLASSHESQRPKKGIIE